MSRNREAVPRSVVLRAPLQIAVAVVLVGHVIVSAGILAGYRGVWRAMHGDGRVPVEVARRLWPGWTEHRLDEGHAK